MNKDKLAEAAEVVRNRFRNPEPQIGFILGSGLAEAADIFEVKDEIQYADIPCLGKPTVDGHAGKLILAEHEGVLSFVFLGRRHWYEGTGWEPIAAPIYLLKSCSARAVVITNVAAGIRDDLLPGRLMLIDDHINMIGSHPLLGCHNPFFGPRFPDQSTVYDPKLREAVDAAAACDKQDVAHGVYLAVSGPAYETPAEIRAFRTLGADAVGMSTVPEASLANAAGLRVLGASCIVNEAACLSGAELKHDEVIKAAASCLPKLRWLFKTVLAIRF